MKFSPKVAAGGGGHSFCIRYNFWVSQSVEGAIGKEICGIGFQTSFSLPHKKAGLGKQKNV